MIKLLNTRNGTDGGVTVDYIDGDELIRVEVVHDSDTENYPDPLEYSDGVQVLAAHTRYSLGHERHRNQTPDYVAEWLENNVKGVDDGRKAYYAPEAHNCVVLPIYMYSHSGISLSTKPYNCEWDSGQLGVAFGSVDTINKECVPQDAGQQDTHTPYEHAVLAVERLIEEYNLHLQSRYWGRRVFSCKLLDKNIDVAEADSILSKAPEVDAHWGFLMEDAEGVAFPYGDTPAELVDQLRKTGFYRAVKD